MGEYKLRMGHGGGEGEVCVWDQNMTFFSATVCTPPSRSLSLRVTGRACWKA